MVQPEYLPLSDRSVELSPSVVLLALEHFQRRKSDHVVGILFGKTDHKNVTFVQSALPIGEPIRFDKAESVSFFKRTLEIHAMSYPHLQAVGWYMLGSRLSDDVSKNNAIMCRALESSAHVCLLVDPTFVLRPIYRVFSSRVLCAEKDGDVVATAFSPLAATLASGVHEQLAFSTVGLGIYPMPSVLCVPHLSGQNANPIVPSQMLGNAVSEVREMLLELRKKVPRLPGDKHTFDIYEIEQTRRAMAVLANIRCDLKDYSLSENFDQLRTVLSAVRTHLANTNMAIQNHITKNNKLPQY